MQHIQCMHNALQWLGSSKDQLWKFGTPHFPFLLVIGLWKKPKKNHPPTPQSCHVHMVVRVISIRAWLLKAFYLWLSCTCLREQEEKLFEAVSWRWWPCSATFKIVPPFSGKSNLCLFFLFVEICSFCVQVFHSSALRLWNYLDTWISHVIISLQILSPKVPAFTSTRNPTGGADSPEP